jgi:hypothetical protein
MLKEKGLKSDGELQDRYLGISQELRHQAYGCKEYADGFRNSYMMITATAEGQESFYAFLREYVNSGSITSERFYQYNHFLDQTFGQLEHALLWSPLGGPRPYLRVLPKQAS